MKVISSLLRQLSPTLSTTKPSTGDPPPRMNLLWVRVQLMRGPLGHLWAVLLLSALGERPSGTARLCKRGAEVLQGTPHAPCSQPCRYEHPLKPAAPPRLPRRLLLRLQSKASLGDNRRQLWEAKVTGVPRAPLRASRCRQNGLQAPGVTA